VLLGRLRNNPPAKRVVTASIYACACLPIGHVLAAYYAAQSYTGRAVVMSARIAVVGCIVLAAACFAALLQSSCVVILGIVGASLCWPYFGALAANPWRILDLARHFFYGWTEVWSILSLFVATIYSLVQLRAVLRPSKVNPH